MGGDEGWHARAWGLKVPERLRARWGSLGNTQLVAQAELWPVAVSMVLWRTLLAGKYLVIYLDNQGAKQGLIKGFSPSWHSVELIALTSLAVLELGITPWYTRVPTTSNPADDASRLRVAAALAQVEEAAGTVQRALRHHAVALPTVASEMRRMAAAVALHARHSAVAQAVANAAAEVGRVQAAYQRTAQWDKDAVEHALRSVRESLEPVVHFHAHSLLQALQGDPAIANAV